MPEGTDFSLSWNLTAILPSGEKVIQELTTDETGTVLQWNVTKEITALSGEVSLLLEGVDVDGNIVIRFTGKPISIHPVEQDSIFPDTSLPQDDFPLKIEQIQTSLEELKKLLESVNTSAGNTEEQQNQLEALFQKTHGLIEDFTVTAFPKIDEKLATQVAQANAAKGAALDAQTKAWEAALT